MLCIFDKKRKYSYIYLLFHFVQSIIESTNQIKCKRNIFIFKVYI